MDESLDPVLITQEAQRLAEDTNNGTLNVAYLAEHWGEDAEISPNNARVAARTFAYLLLRQNLELSIADDIDSRIIPQSILQTLGLQVTLVDGNLVLSSIEM